MIAYADVHPTLYHEEGERYWVPELCDVVADDILTSLVDSVARWNPKVSVLLCEPRGLKNRPTWPLEIDVALTYVVAKLQELRQLHETRIVLFTDCVQNVDDRVFCIDCRLDASGKIHGPNMLSTVVEGIVHNRDITPPIRPMLSVRSNVGARVTAHLCHLGRWVSVTCRAASIRALLARLERCELDTISKVDTVDRRALCAAVRDEMMRLAAHELSSHADMQVMTCAPASPVTCFKDAGWSCSGLLTPDLLRSLAEEDVCLTLSKVRRRFHIKRGRVYVGDDQVDITSPTQDGMSITYSSHRPTVRLTQSTAVARRESALNYNHRN